MSLLLSLLALILGAVAVMLGLKARRAADGLARRLRELEDQVASQSSRIASAGRTLRYASLVVMLLAVGKVFLFDTRNLSDLYRVFSFLGLGLSLLLLAWLYQRFVFRRSSTARQTQPAS